LAGGVLCSNAVPGATRETDIGNPTEISIVRAAFQANIDFTKMRQTQPIINQIPFSSEYKFMATIHEPVESLDQIKTGFVMHVKGAPDRLIAHSDKQLIAGQVGQLEPINREYWLAQAASLSSHGLRVLALCRAEILEPISGETKLDAGYIQSKEPFLTIVGLCAIMDPPRPECVDAIKQAHGAGIRVAMITGDHKDTALAIGNMLGLVDETFDSAVTGPEMDAMSDEELREAVMTHNIFARASPENKIKIVKALQAEGQIASMTGDGVNDAPALKAADMGVAMGKEGTDVAREASEMILADDNFATIVEAVRLGRGVWTNIRKILLFNTPVNNAQGLTVLVGIAAGLEETPLTPIQVLYCNLICAVTLGMVLAIEPAEAGIMKESPRRPGKRLVGRFLLLRIIIGTVALVATTIGALFWVRSWGLELPQQRSQTSNTLTFGAISIMLSARFSYESSFHPRIFFGNKFAWYSVFITVVLQVCITYIPGLNSTVFRMGPMSADQWGIVILMMFVVFITMETEKAIRRSLKVSGFDTDDAKEDLIFDEPCVHSEEPLAPPESLRSGLLNSTLLKH